MDFLKGKKTYVIMAIGVLTAVGAYLTGDLTLIQAIQAVLGALGLGALRGGVSKIGK